MDWITRAEVQNMARISGLAAAKSSLLHWMQTKTAGSRQLRAAIETGKVGHGGNWCALCSCYPACCGCPLASGAGILCCIEYEKAKGALWQWQHGTGVYSYKEVQKAITPLTRRLRTIVRSY